MVKILYAPLHVIIMTEFLSMKLKNSMHKLKKDGPTSEAPSYGLNSTLVKEGDSIREVYGSLVANIMQQSKRLYIG